MDPGISCRVPEGKGTIPLSSSSKSTKTLYKTVCAIVGGIALLCVALWLKFGDHTAVRGQYLGGNTEAEPSQPPSSYRFGFLTVTTTGSKEVVLGRNSIIASPVAAMKISWEEYINGKFSRAFGLDSPPGPSKIDAPAHTISWRIADGQAMTDVQFVYCMYQGNDPPKDWYDRALLALKQ